MKTAKWCIENVNSGDVMKFSSVMGEVTELIEARSMDEVKEEAGDVLYFTYCWLYSSFRINLPMIGAMGSVRKFIARLDVWRNIFAGYGLEFSPKYLVGGSNYKKQHKIDAAIALARKEQ